MKKKLLLLILFCVLFLTGCNGSVTRDFRKLGFEVSNDKLVCSTLIPKTEGQLVSEKISYMNELYAVTESGNIYEISVGQKYSNNENCKKADTMLKVSALMDDSIARGIDGKFYYMQSDSGVKAYSEIGINDDSYQLCNILLSSPEVKRVVTVDSNKGIYYALLTDGNVYKYVIKRDNYDDPYRIESRTIEYSEEQYGKIIDFNYNDSEKDKTYVKTNDTIYRMQAINRDRCERYADVSCNYKFMRDEVMTKYYKTKILYYGPKVLITTYGRIFN